jgi:hypothetical protein
MNKKLYIPFAILILMGLVLPIFSATTETYKVGESTNLILTCTINNAVPSASATMNLTIAYPNGSLFVNNKGATDLGNGVFNYTTIFPIIGIYHPTLVCIDGTNSNSNSNNEYEITGNGKTAPQGNIIVLFSIAFLVIIGFALYEFIVSIGHLASLDLDVIDLAKSIGIYFALFGIYFLSLFYLGNTIIEGFLVLFIQIGAFTHIIVPITGFLISITVGSLRKKKVEFGTRRIYRRQKIGN